jgi:hypothetical protein
MSDINGQIVNVMPIPRIFLVCGATFRKRLEITAKQKTKSQQ